jgi:hypothetical protein
MKQNRRRKRIIFSSIFGFLLVILLLGYLFLFSPVFKIKNIEISQTRITDSNVIRQDIQKILDQGVILGPLVITNNILFVPVIQINDYLRGLPAIAIFSQDRGFFSGILKINIQEREVTGVLKQASGGGYYFDKGGVIFSNTADDTEGEMFFTIENNLNRQFDLGDRILEGGSFQELMNIVQLMNDNFFSNRVKLQKDKLEISVTLHDDKETSFYLNVDNLSQTLSVITYFIQNNFNFDLEYLDLRYLPNVYYK